MHKVYIHENRKVLQDAVIARLCDVALNLAVDALEQALYARHPEHNDATVCAKAIRQPKAQCRATLLL